ncbi:MAG: tetratricopeptide repeat protein [Akkermansiaceae bacterium]
MLQITAKRYFGLCFLALVLTPLLIAEDSVFQLDKVIHPRVAALPTPKVRPEIVGTKMTIFSSSEKAVMHVQQGFSLVHAQWDFEAYRHFSAALKEDPDCLMAYVGVVFALAKPFHEYMPYRHAAVNRMLDLMEADDKATARGKELAFPELEKQFAYAAATLVSVSPKGAGEMFTKMGEEYPHLIQARLIGIYLSRGSYDVNGYPSPEQKLALKKTKQLMQEYPENPLVNSFLISLMANAPTTYLDLKKEVLPFARFLVKRSPDMPTFQYSLGHYEWRAGNYLLAEQAFRKTISLYGEWMMKNGIELSDCEGYVLAHCYLANTLYQRGDFAGAMQVAMDIRNKNADEKRLTSLGTQALLWRAYTLPAHLYAARGAEGDMDLAHAAMPDKHDLKYYFENQEVPTAIGGYIESLAAYVGSRKALDDNVLKAAKVIHKEIFTQAVRSMSKTVEVVQQTNEFSNFVEATTSLAIYDMELSGLIAMADSADAQVAAPNWFRSARDRQTISVTMTPPHVITPMEHRLGDCYFKRGDYQEAYTAYNEALKKRPNSMMSLLALKNCLDLMNDGESAEKVQRHIDEITP